jgi:hypothetical protein
VDTGAGDSSAPNPDLDNVVARLAVDGASPDDLSPGAHGTLMAMIAAAPHNGFGMVGAAPSIDVVSVRASRDGRTFGSADVTTAIQKCVSYRNAYNIKVVSLSLGGPVSAGLDLASMGATEDAVSNARRAGLDVVAAAGNHPGAVDWPAGYGPVLAVGAADQAGAMCSFAASGPEVDLWASGCPQDVALPDGRAAWATGSSEATAFVAAALAELRGLRPDLTPDAAEAVLVAHANPTAAGSSLDVDAAFRAAGLGEQLAAGHAAIPTPPVLTPSDQQTTPQSVADTSASAPAATQQTVAPDVQPPPASAKLGVALQPLALTALARTRMAMPAVRSVQMRRGVLAIVFKNKPKGVQARVEVYARKKGRAFPTLARSLRVTGDRLRTRVSGTVSQVSITYRDPTGAKAPSAELTVHPRT